MQQPGFHNVQLWQQLLMYKEIKESQNQQPKIKQTDQGTRQQHSLSQLPGPAKQTTLHHLPALMNEVPVNHASDFIWPNTFVPNMPMVPVNAQTFISDNMNCLQLNGPSAMPNIAKGFIISNDQIQAIQSLGSISQQHDQTFHGIPVSRTRGSMHEHSQFLGASSDCTASTIKGGRNEAVKTLDPFSSFQNDQAFCARNFSQEGTFAIQNSLRKGSFNNASVQILSNHAKSGNVQQSDHLKQRVHAKELQKRHSKANSSNFLDTPTVQVETFQNVPASLEPTEQKLLFGSDDYHHLGDPLVGSLNSCSGNSLSGSSMENSCFGAIPSMKSGSWSAFMQEAVQACSSDLGLQEEWSGLSFQKMEQSVVKDSVVSNDYSILPTTWDDSYLQTSSSLTSKPHPLYNDADACSNSGTSPGFHNSFTHDQNIMVQNGASHIIFEQSAVDYNHKHFHQVQKQKQFFEGVLEAQVPSTDELWAEQSYKQCANDSADMQDLEDSWTYQQNLTLVDFPGESSNRSNGWNSSYSTAPGRNCTSDVCDNDGNVEKFGVGCMNVNGGEQPDESDIGSSLQAEDILADRYGSVVNTNNLELTTEMNQLITNSSAHSLFETNFTPEAYVNSRVNENVGRNKNLRSGRLQTWDNINKRLISTHHNKNEDIQMVTSDSLNHHQYSNTVNGSKQTCILTANDQNSFVRGSQKSTIQTVQEIVDSKMMQSTVRSLGMYTETLFSTNQPLISQSMPNFLQGSNSKENILAGKSKFDDHVDSNVVDLHKKTTMEAQKLQSRATIPIHASSSSIDRSIGQYCPNDGIAQTSQNIHELLHKIDQPINAGMTAQAAYKLAHFGQPSAVQGFGLQLGPSSQQFPHLAFSSATSLNDVRNRELDQHAGNMDQTRLVSIPAVQSLSLCETSVRENLGNIPRQKLKENFDSDKQYSTLSDIDPKFCYVGNQLQGQQSQQCILNAKVFMEQQQNPQQIVPSFTGYGTTDQSMKISNNAQTYVNSVDENASLIQQEHRSGRPAVADQSIWASFPPLPGRLTPSGASSPGDARVVIGSRLTPGDAHVLIGSQITPDDACILVGSELQSEMKINTKQMITDFSQISSSMCPSGGTMSGLPPTIVGMSQQAEPSMMLSNMANISAQQCQAGHRRLQSNNVREKGFWHLQRTNDQKSKRGSASSEMGTSTFLQNRENSNKGTSSKPTISDKDAITKEETDFQGQELVRNAPISSLGHLYQQGMDRAESGQNSSLCSQSVHNSITRIASLHVQHHSQRLPHQMQSMREAHSDPSKKLSSRLKGSDFDADSSPVYWNKNQRYVYGQDADFRIPDDKVGANSQNSADATMPNFTAKEKVQKNAIIYPTAERQDIQNHLSSLCTSSAANLLRENECAQINPLMTPSWFEMFGTYKNDPSNSGYDGQKSTKAVPHQKFFSKVVPGSSDNNLEVEPRSGIDQVCTYEQSASTAKVASDGISIDTVPPTTISHILVSKSRKRKRATAELVPWHKVTQGLQKLQSISMTEIDWTNATNKLIEKAYDVAETTENVSSTMQPRRRLILTTQLMQQLFPVVPPSILNLEASLTYENVTFLVAKSMLADACSLNHSFERPSLTCLDKGIMYSEKDLSSKDGHVCSKIMEVLIGRCKKIESDSSRWNERTSILDVRTEWQELEKFSIVNRLGKFHGQRQPPTIEGSPFTYGPALYKTFLQSHVAKHPFPGNIPEGFACLSL